MKTKFKTPRLNQQGFTRHTSLKRSLGGFTIVELMIASVVFATILLLITVAVMHIGRTYFKGITSTRTQESARLVVEEISQAVQFGSGDPEIIPAVNPGEVGMVCAGGKKFSYQIDRMVSPSSSNKGIILTDVSSCNGQTPNLSGRELLGARMRVARLEVVPASDNLYRINISIVSGDNDLLTDNTADPNYHKECKLDSSGLQFCAVSELSTVIKKRVL